MLLFTVENSLRQQKLIRANFPTWILCSGGILGCFAKYNVRMKYTKYAY